MGPIAEMTRATPEARAVPTVTAVAPTYGPTAGGTTVTLTGTGVITALVFATDYITDYIDPLDLGPIVLSVVGVSG